MQSYILFDMVFPWRDVYELNFQGRSIMSPPEAMPGKLFLKGEERTAEDRSIYDAYVRYGYTMKEIAEHLGFHYATISRAI